MSLQKITNIEFCKQVLQKAIDQGVRTFCVCAGARNAPMVLLLDQLLGQNNFEVLPFFEERSAGFFALGRARRDQRPVAVVTTSGTAVAELLPAVIEAYYSKIPLIMMTADRPMSYRGSGAPQSIEQKALFGVYAQDWDLDIQSDLSTLSRPILDRVYHWNVCLDEPLIDEANLTWSPSLVNAFDSNLESSKKLIDINWSGFTKPLVIVSNLDRVQAKKIVEILKIWNLPIYAEANSQLHSFPEISSLILSGSDKCVSRLASENLIDSVIRIGGVPTLRFWRDLESKRIDIPVVSIAIGGFSGLSRSSQSVIELNDFLNQVKIDSRWLKTSFSTNWDGIRKIDLEMSHKLSSYLDQFRLSEPSWVLNLSKLCDGHFVYIGNSLPIRHWDLVASLGGRPFEIFSNRGANGIDGQISTFLGWVRPNRTHFCLVGDLTALYDLSALAWSSNFRDEVFKSGTKIRICILNNRGGQIFRSMFSSKLFINAHQTDFSHWAKMFGWSYVRLTDPKDLLSDKFDPLTIVELVPNQEQSDSFNGWFK